MKTKTEKIFILKLKLKLERIFQNYIKTYTKILSQYENITAGCMNHLHVTTGWTSGFTTGWFLFLHDATGWTTAHQTS